MPVRAAQACDFPVRYKPQRIGSIGAEFMRVWVLFWARTRGMSRRDTGWIPVLRFGSGNGRNDSVSPLREESRRRSPRTHVQAYTGGLSLSS